MNIIRVNEQGNIVEIIDCSADMTSDNLRLIEDIPNLIHKEGYVGILKYSEDQGAYWEYEENIPPEEITYTEMQEMISNIL